MTMRITGLFWLLATSNTQASSGIVIYVMESGQTDTVVALRWILACMIMCIGIESAIYKYSRFVRNPFIIGITSNVATSIVGIPSAMALVRALDAFNIHSDTIFILFIVIIPIFISTGLDGIIVMTNVKTEFGGQIFKILSYVVAANIITHLIFFVYYIYAI